MALSRKSFVFLTVLLCSLVPVGSGAAYNIRIPRRRGSVEPPAQNNRRLDFWPRGSIDSDHYPLAMKSGAEGAEENGWRPNWSLPFLALRRAPPTPGPAPCKSWLGEGMCMAGSAAAGDLVAVATTFCQ